MFVFMPFLYSNMIYQHKGYINQLLEFPQDIITSTPISKQAWYHNRSAFTHNTVIAYILIFSNLP